MSLENAAPVEGSHASRSLEEAHHTIEHHGAGRAASWIPIAAAVLALLAASSGLLANLRVTQTNAAKSDAIIFMTQAADTYNEYDTRSVKEHIYSAALEGATDPKHAARLKAVADHEHTAKAPLLVKARGLEAQSRASTLRAERILTSHEILEIATTMFEISIVLVSVTALVGSRLLPLSALLMTVLGVAIAARGLWY